MRKTHCQLCNRRLRDDQRCGAWCFECSNAAELAAAIVKSHHKPPPADELEGRITIYSLRALAGLPLWVPGLEFRWPNPA